MQNATRTRACPVDGVLLLDKPTGITSNAAIQRVKRLFNAAKAGHVGTLDPLASGLLPVCLGEATKFSTDTFGADKGYDADVLLGVTTATGDTEGEVTSRQAASVAPDQLNATLARFTGALQQIPPMYSALKRDGKPLYAYARAGETVERAPRSITIYSMALLDFSADRFTISVYCSKGTYIRVLAEDIGRDLGCGATLAGLRRTSVGEFGLDGTITLASLENLPAARRVDHLLPVDCLVAGLPAVILPADAVARILQGQSVRVDALPETAGLARLYNENRHFLGLGELQSDGRVLPKRLLANAAAAPAHGSQIQKIA
ncbi:MAG: tRNA pseudouridine(55) synthase TruB [Burkholderiales bacterium]